jgi:hypothetical protein
MSTLGTIGSAPVNVTTPAKLMSNSFTKRSLLITIPLVMVAVVIMLIVAVVLLLKGWELKMIRCIVLRSQNPLLPVTEQPPPRNLFIQRHLEDLRNWQKPAVPSSERSQSSDRPEMTQVPTLAHHEPSRVPKCSLKMTYQEWQEWYRNHSPTAEERHRYMCEESVPTSPNRAYWPQVYAEQQVRPKW